MSKYQYAGVRATAEVARALIRKWLPGKGARARAEIIEECERLHVSQGGLRHYDPTAVYKKALGDLRKKGIAMSVVRGHWRIDSDPESGQTYDLQATINRHTHVRRFCTEVASRTLPTDVTGVQVEVRDHEIAVTLSISLDHKLDPAVLQDLDGLS